MKKNDNIPLNYREKSNSRISFLVSIGVLVALCLAFNQVDYNLIRKPAQEAKKAAEAQKKKEEEAAEAPSRVSTATILAVGDNLVQPSLLNSGRSDSGEWNYDHVFTNLLPQIQGADLAIVNQETPFTTDHEAVSGVAPYSTPAEMGDSLVAAGFDVVTSATSFMDDNGYDFLSQTLDFWKNSHPETTVPGLHETKEDAYVPRILKVNDISIAFLNCTYPSYRSSESAQGTDQSYIIDTFDQSALTTAIQSAKASADCVIFAANWGKTEEPMPTEYQKQWANFLMKQGVDVVIGTNPNVLQPYGYLTDDEGHHMLIYYSLGNFVTGQETLKQLLGGMASFTIEKTVAGEETSVRIKNASLTPLVMHYSYNDAQYTPYLLSDYTEELASRHSVRDILGEEFSLANLQTKYDEIMSMNVTPSTKSSLLDVSFDSDGGMLDSSGSYVEDTDSITSGQYYQNLASGSATQEES
ncbi:MAG: CapA family protein [Eubacteriales bacterium]|nr:CapA family protein [Eubacteriales bacterium]